MTINHSGFLNKYWTNHRVILRYVNLNMINYMLGHHMTSPHHTRPSPKKRRSISQFCSLVAKRIWMICCQFSIPVFTLLGKIQWVWVFHDMRSLSYYLVKRNIFTALKTCFLVLKKYDSTQKTLVWKEEEIVVKNWSKMAVFYSRVQGGPEGCEPPRNLADQLTLFKLGVGGRLCHTHYYLPPD